MLLILLLVTCKLSSTLSVVHTFYASSCKTQRLCVNSKLVSPLYRMDVLLSLLLLLQSISKVNNLINMVRLFLVSTLHTTTQLGMATSLSKLPMVEAVFMMISRIQWQLLQLRIYAMLLFLELLLLLPLPAVCHPVQTRGHLQFNNVVLPLQSLLQLPLQPFVLLLPSV